MTENKALVMATANGMIDKSKELQKEILMEKLRSKTSQFKNLSETSKAVRMAMLELRMKLCRDSVPTILGEASGRDAFQEYASRVARIAIARNRTTDRDA